MRVSGPGKAVDLNLTKELTAQQPVEKPAPDVKEVKVQSDPVKAVKENEPHSIKLEDSVELANTAMQISSYNLQFRVHEESGRVQVKVVDSQSGEVLKEIPSEQMLEISASIKEMLEKFDKMVGVLVDEFV